MQDITQNLHDLEQDSSTKAIIVTSGLDRLFCAGLDLTEMYQPSSMERMQDFRRAHQDLFLKIYGCKKTTFAAIAGPAPAAGCMIALCCDYRVLQEASTRGVASMIVSVYKSWSASDRLPYAYELFPQVDSSSLALIPLT